MSQEKIEIMITRSSDFKILYASGVFGGLNPMEGRITFYVDRIIPKIVEETKGLMKTGHVERELQTEIHMSPQQFIALYQWMQSHIQRLQSQGILVKKEEEPKSIVKKEEEPKSE